MAKLSSILETEIAFRKKLATGQPVALEDATRDVDYGDGFDKRTLGVIPRCMQIDGEIVEAGFRRGISLSCNSAPKRLWVAVDPSTIFRRRARQ
jgi:hypothetical protein